MTIPSLLFENAHLRMPTFKFTMSFTFKGNSIGVQLDFPWKTYGKLEKAFVILLLPPYPPGDVYPMNGENRLLH